VGTKRQLGRGLAGLVVVALMATACGTSAKPVTSARASTPQTPSVAKTAQRLFPNGITLVANLPPGGVTYTDGEAVQPFLQKVLGVPVTVRPVVGGGGNTAAQYVYAAPAGSGTLMMAYLPQLAIGGLVGHGSYKILDYTPLAGMFGDDTSIYVAKRGSPFKDFSSLQRATSTITIGVFGVKSSSGWMSAQFLSKLNHIKTTTVPYKNAAAEVDAVLSGAVDLASITRAQAIPYIAEGRVQPVLQFAPKPLSYLPGTDAIGQVASPKESFYNLGGVVGPPHMPSAESKLLQRALAEVAKDPAFQARAHSLAVVPSYQDATTWSASLHSAYSLVKSHLGVLTG
jgi:tripartite-type tricarboxylate transporter receptor subunit TctC